MKEARIKTIFFDAADTLFYIEKGLGQTYAEVARKYGASPDPGEIKRAFSPGHSIRHPRSPSEMSQTKREKGSRRNGGGP